MTDLLQTLFSGVALGTKYSLVALGFVVIFRATGVINFAQGGFVIVGAYLTYNFSVTWGFNFYLSVLLAMICGAALGAFVEYLVLRRMVGEASFSVIMLTIGLLFVIRALVPTVWGFANLQQGDPWGIDTVELGGVVFAVRELWTIAAAAGALLLFFLLFRYSKIGVAMRAVAIDQEAALAQGISVNRVVSVSWAIAGAVATLAGVALSTGNAQLAPTIEYVALAAFPAMILGGLDSPLGAVVGGLIIGIVQQLTGLYQPQYAEWLGDGFSLVAPYVVMVIILIVKPYGLFGTEEVRRA
jgi:branched-chain amino acid transport system permease protein